MRLDAGSIPISRWERQGNSNGPSSLVPVRSKAQVLQVTSIMFLDSLCATSGLSPAAGAIEVRGRQEVQVPETQIGRVRAHGWSEPGEHHVPPGAKGYAVEHGE